MCGKDLENIGFFVESNQYYCPEDFQERFGTKCFICHLFVEGEGINIGNNAYHLRCFVCTGCRWGFFLMFFIIYTWKTTFNWDHLNLKQSNSDCQAWGYISNGKTDWSSIQSVIIWVINKIRWWQVWEQKSHGVVGAITTNLFCSCGQKNYGFYCKCLPLDYSNHNIFQI